MQELAQIRVNTKELSAKFNSLDAQFKSLPNSAKRVVLSEEEISCSTFPSSSSNEDGERSCSPQEGVQTTLDDQEQQKQRQTVVAFHESADAVLAVLGDMQHLVRSKHTEVATQGENSQSSCFPVSRQLRAAVLI